MIILGIETSCDETAVSILECISDSCSSVTSSSVSIRVLGNALYSQVKVHEKYGGVFPMLAKREHSKNLIPLLKKTLEESSFLNNRQQTTDSKQQDKIKKILEREPELLQQFLEFIPNTEKPPIDAIAVTYGPGLEPALWVGISFAKALSEVWNIPIVPVNHMEGHILSALLSGEISNFQFPISKQIQNSNIQYLISNIKFPLLALLVSGGHTELVLSEDFGKYKILGQTKDDSVGEAFDKVARILGLPYPGGPGISRLADSARENELRIKNYEVREKTEEKKLIKIKLPRPMLHSGDYNFSFSGLKTAVLYMVKKIPELTENIKAEVAKEFEDAAVEVLTAKTKTALENNSVKSLVLGGGVSANIELRKSFEKLASEFPELKLYTPQLNLSGDNSIMIAIAGYFDSLKKEKSELKKEELKAEGNLRLN